MSQKQHQTGTNGTHPPGKNGSQRKAVILAVEIAFTHVPQNTHPQEWQYCSASEAMHVSLFRRVHLPTQPESIPLREAATEWIADFSLKSIDHARDTAVRLARSARVELIGNAVTEACRRRLHALSQCYLDISILHIRKQTLQMLETRAYPGIDVMDLDLGLFIPLPSPVEALDAPPDLDAIFEYAKEIGCGYVRLYPDGTKYSALPQYWDDPE